MPERYMLWFVVFVTVALILLLLGLFGVIEVNGK
jgi:hypothetical protein